MRKLFMVVAIGGLAMCTAAQAHHSSAMFDDSKCITVVGTVRTVQLTYPHAWLWLIVSDKKGVEEVWGFENADPATLRVSGWSKTSLKPGDKVSVVYKPLKDGRSGGSLQRMTFPDGHVYSNQIFSCPGDAKSKAGSPVTVRP